MSRIDAWLAEGIDIDADGQFSERSTSVYSPTCDRALLTVARFLGRDALLEPVRRNLEMTLFYLHADGDVATEASRRQDQYRRGSPAGYHLPYRSLALRDGNGRFAAAARLIEAKEGDALAGNLIHFLDDPSLREPLPSSAPLPDDFARPFPGSDLVRIRRGAVSATVLGGNSCVLSFRKGAAALEAVRLASAFFGKGQFVAERLAVEGNGAYVLTQSLTGPYYQPLPSEARHADGAWDPGDRVAPAADRGADGSSRASWCANRRVPSRSTWTWRGRTACPSRSSSASAGAVLSPASSRSPERPTRSSSAVRPASTGWVARRSGSAPAGPSTRGPTCAAHCQSSTP